MADGIYVTIRLPEKQMEYLNELSKLSGASVQDVFNVILSMHILREKLK